MIWRRLMSWLLPHRAHAEQARLAAVLAENELAREYAETIAGEAQASAAANQLKLEETREEIRRRTQERRERAQERAAKDPGLGAVNEVLKLLERRG